MSNLGGLVAYGSDSDDEEMEGSPQEQGVTFQVSSSSSPAKPPSKPEETFKERARRRDSEHFTDEGSSDEKSDHGKRPRQASDSPAPLMHPAVKRLAIPQTTSQVSLVSYGGDEEDDFEKEDIRLSREEAVRSPTRSGTATAEPKPPRGHDEDDKDDSPEIIMADIDNFEAAKLAWKHEDGGTPQSVGSVEEETIEERKERENAVQMPSPPREPCAPELENLFNSLFEKKFKGELNPTKQIQERKDFKNPSIYEKFIEFFDLDEIGSNFSKDVYDPHVFDDSGPERGQGFYDRIREKQSRMDQHRSSTSSSSAAAKRTADSKSKASSGGSRKK
uniref:HCNGP-like protein n=1 Tax=Steinernema glaseri TaxID=37863 RepID=A0A1I7ZSB7_9BILA